MNGKVTKFFRNKGYGFIVDDKNQSYFFHISDVIEGNRFDIQPGLMADFSSSLSSKGLVAKEISFDIINDEKQIDDIIKEINDKKANSVHLDFKMLLTILCLLLSLILFLFPSNQIQVRIFSGLLFILFILRFYIEHK